MPLKKAAQRQASDTDLDRLLKPAAQLLLPNTPWAPLSQPAVQRQPSTRSGHSSPTLQGHSGQEGSAVVSASAPLIGFGHSHHLLALLPCCSAGFPARVVSPSPKDGHDKRGENPVSVVLADGASRAHAVLVWARELVCTCMHVPCIAHAAPGADTTSKPSTSGLRQKGDF